MLDPLPLWVVCLFIALILLIDILSVVMFAIFGTVFLGFKAGKAIYDYIQGLLDKAINTLLRLIQDVLESPPLDRASGFTVLIVVGLKAVYDIINVFQKLIEIGISIAVTLLFIVVSVCCLIVLAVLNIFLIWLILHYVMHLALIFYILPGV